MFWTQFIAATWCHVSRWMKIIKHNLENLYEDWIQDETFARFFPARPLCITLNFLLKSTNLSRYQVRFSNKILESNCSTWKITYGDFRSNSMLFHETKYQLCQQWIYLFDTFVLQTHEKSFSFFTVESVLTLSCSALLWPHCWLGRGDEVVILAPFLVTWERINVRIWNFDGRELLFDIYIY